MRIMRIMRVRAGGRGSVLARQGMRRFEVGKLVPSSTEGYLML